MPTTLEVDTPHGRCVVLDLHDHDDLATVLLPDEHLLAERLGPARRRELAAGRSAMRSALGIATAILIDDRGAPVLPPGWVGSISHKGSRAAALVAPANGAFIGIDIEVAAPPRAPIERRILTERERAAIASGTREVTRAFAIKEAIYKAIDPIVRRYVGFTEVELVVHEDGRCDVQLVDAAALPVVVEAHWQERDGYWLATARATRRA